MEKINNQERAQIFDDLLEELSGWDWTDNFEMDQLEGEAILYLLERWKVRRTYLKNRYDANKQHYIDDNTRRYHKNKEELRRKRLEKLHGKL